ncbi:geranylgeranyl pyrophosphate synthetase [Ophiocordyceps sinensis CO18]|nr:geranylgeranyl pyrophosphate synthetase [Ophiocordyceps sinensis CO18]
MVHNTLFIERCEMHPEFLTGQGGSRGFGHNFERAFTKFPSGENNNAGYHRCLRYHIGDLNCAVQFEVDARFGEPETTKIDAEAEDVGLSLARLTLAETKGGGGVSKESSLAPQSAVIEAKTLLADRDWDRDLPQLWFGRVPWLMIGRHDAGLFTSVDVVDTGPRLAEWEEDSQPQLRKLATLLTQLRQAVTMFGGRNCAAIHQPGGLSGPVIYVCESKLGRRALPDDFIQHAWAPAKGATGEI